MQEVLKCKKFSYLNITKRLRKFYTSQSRSLQLYKIGWFFLVFAILGFILGSMFGIMKFYISKLVIQVLFLFFILFILLGFIKDAIDFGVKVWSSKVGKTLLGFVGASIIQVSYIMACREVNSLTALAPSNFEVSITVFTLILVPFVTTAFFMVALILFLLIYLAVIPLEAIKNIKMIRYIRGSFMYRYAFRPKEKKYSEILTPSRLSGAYITLAILAISFPILSNQYNHLANMKKKLIANIDFYPSSFCGTTKDERILHLKGKLISVATFKDNKWSFPVRECKN